MSIAHKHELSSESEVRLARRIVSDLFTLHPHLYFFDLAVTLVLAYGCALLFLLSDGVLAWVGALVAGPALYRLATFIHEIAHFPSKEMQSFTNVWNLAVGVPFLMPAHFYESHLEHHSSRHYGTERDGEYLPLGAGSPFTVVFFFLQPFLLPGIVFLRFLVGTPLSFCRERIRRIVSRYFSSLVINWTYRRSRSDKRRHGRQQLVELLCSACAWSLLFGLLFGITDWMYVVKLYVLASYSLALNYLRTFAAHHYRSDGSPLTVEEQLDDSVTIEGGWLTDFLFPLGMRYHALHHMLPTIPYYNLRDAHERLMQELPVNAVYRRTVYPSLWSVLALKFHITVPGSKFRET